MRSEIESVLRETAPDDYDQIRGAHDIDDQLLPSPSNGFDEDLVYGEAATPDLPRDEMSPVDPLSGE